MFEARHVAERPLFLIHSFQVAVWLISVQHRVCILAVISVWV